MSEQEEKQQDNLSPYAEVRLTNINDGAAVELFDEELKKVMNNIMDVTVDSLKPREINLKFKIIPNKDRQSAQIIIQSSSKLISIKEHQSAVLLTHKGVYQANSKQLDMFDKEKKASQ